MVVDRVSADLRAAPGPRERTMRIKEAVGVSSQRILCVKPRTFMNRSGIAVGRLVRHWGLLPSECLIVYDDISLPFGRLRMREKGSAGSHNGMASVLETLQTREVPRLRVGIGASNHVEGLAEYVLTPFSPGERRKLPEICSAAAEVAQLWTDGATDQAIAKASEFVLTM